jgi:hypothetical protein
VRHRHRRRAAAVVGEAVAVHREDLEQVRAELLPVIARGHAPLVAGPVGLVVIGHLVVADDQRLAEAAAVVVAQRHEEGEVERRVRPLEAGQELRVVRAGDRPGGVDVVAEAQGEIAAAPATHRLDVARHAGLGLVLRAGVADDDEAQARGAGQQHGLLGCRPVGALGRRRR